MYSKILIRMGEIFTKGKNKPNFIRKLAKNIKLLAEVEPDVQYDRIYVPYSEKNMEKLQFVFGIYSYSPVIEVKPEVEEIEKAVKEITKELPIGSFKVEVKRAWKKFPINSQQFAAQVGGYILSQNENLTVNVRKPDTVVEVEIRNSHAFIFVKRVKGLGGYPTGINGKVLHLISGGIDSPVAALELMKRGMYVDFLNFITPPFTDDKTVKKVNKIINFLNQYQGSSRLYRSNYTDLMNLIGLTSDQSYKINIMRRSFYRIASKIASKHRYVAIANGDNLGQVASQTPESLLVISSQSTFPLYRPLLTADKIDTIAKAKRFGTYEISIEKANESCEIFAPKAPVIKPTIRTAERLEAELMTIFDLEEENIENHIEIVDFKK